jgi:hypothetical protein
MSYSYNQRSKNLNHFKKSKNQRLFFFEIDGVKKTFRNINGNWKTVNYVEPVTVTSK